MNFARQFTVAALYSLALAALIPLSAVKADDTDSSIVNSEFCSLRLHVPRGSTLEITNSKLCLSSSAQCEIVLEPGAKLTAANSVFGQGLTIYHDGAFTDALNLENVDVLGKIKEGIPAHCGAVSFYEQQSEFDRSVVNTTLESFSSAVRSGGTLEVMNSHLCEDSNLSPLCLVRVDQGARLKFGNSTFGKRITIAIAHDYLTQIEAANVHFYGSMASGAIDTFAGSINSRVSTISAENRRVISELEERHIEAKSNDRGVVINLPEVFFEFDKAALTDEAQKNVAAIGKILNSVGERSVSVEGHTDAIGSNAYNEKLSLARASSVSVALQNAGISKSRLSAIGFGKQRPVADNQSEAGRARNRRVEVVLLNGDVAKSTSNTEMLNRKARTGDLKHLAVQQNDEVEDSKAGSAEVRFDEQGISMKAPNGEFHLSEDGIRVKMK